MSGFLSTRFSLSTPRSAPPPLTTTECSYSFAIAVFQIKNASNILDWSSKEEAHCPSRLPDSHQLNTGTYVLVGNVSLGPQIMENRKNPQSSIGI